MRRFLAVLSLVAAAFVAPAAVSAPAHAAELTRVYSSLPLEVCQSFGRSGVETGRWSTWWCAETGSGTPFRSYDLWAYVL